jgi:hypothetical protein
MDIGIFIVIMIVLYVVPELLKRFKAKPQYKYPEIPSTPTAEGPMTDTEFREPMVLPSISDEGRAGDEGDPSWVVRSASEQVGARGLVGEREASPALDLSLAAQGVMWSEILARPVSMRPMRHGTRRLA